MDESDFDENTETNLPTPPQSENVLPIVTVKGGKSGTSATAAKARAKRTSGRISKNVATTTAQGKREALVDISNSRNAASDTEEVDDFDDELGGGGLTTTTRARMAPKKAASTKSKVAKQSKNAAKPKTSNEAPEVAVAIATNEDRLEIPETQEDALASSKLAKSTAAARKKAPRPAKREVIPETQAEPMDVDDSAIQEPDPIDDPNPPAKTTHGAHSTSLSRQRQTSVPRRRAGSASDTERAGNDPTLRRKLADMTRKFEALEVKYQNLHDVGVVEAESNFDKLRKKTDEKTKAANDLISSLRAELSVQKAAATEAAALRKEIAQLQSHNENLVSEKKTLASSLGEAQTEAKTLHAKLAATRATSNPAQGSSAPISKASGAKTLLVSNAEAAKEAQKRMLKEDLYSDLTGLILLDVKRREEDNEDVYDCIQTGRNGTLHFHLTVADPSDVSNTKPTAAPNTAYQDAEFQYTPLLNEQRDKDLMDILPDYLTEEICFPRSNAAKFYSRVVDCMTKKIELVEE